jgi:hypothetical protein
MPKPICTHWFLQKIADMVVQDVAPGLPIIAVVKHDDDKIIWDDECKGLGRAPWYCGYFISPEHEYARALVPQLNAEIARYQKLYDLGLTCDKS